MIACITSSASRRRPARRRQLDLLPEIYKMAATSGTDATGAMIALVGGFLFFHTLEKFVLLHHVHEGAYAAHRHRRFGVFSALALVGHSFMDGIGIGLAFQVSKHMGLVVGAAVIAHDFCDGLNTVSLMLVNNEHEETLVRHAPARRRRAGAGRTVHAGLHAAAVGIDVLPRLLRRIPALHQRVDILPEAHSQAPPAGF